MFRRRPRSVTKIICVGIVAFFALGEPALSSFSCGTTANVKLTRIEQDLLKRTKDREEAAGLTSIFLVIGPIIDCFTSKPIECVFSVQTTEWDQIAKTPGSIQKILASAILTDITVTLGGSGGSTQSRPFFSCVSKYYQQFL